MKIPSTANPADPATTHRVKCVVWDLDGTVWDGVAVESETEELPEPRLSVLRAVDVLAQHGVMSSIASRTAPAVLDLVRADPRFADRFLAPQVGWQDKSDSLRRIASELGIGLSSLVLVDDSPYERAEVSAMLPEVLVLAPESVPELLEALGSATVTEEASRRVARYREEALRKQAGLTFSGSREEFLHSCEMRLLLGTADDADVDRFVELAVRTHRLNSSGLVVDADRVRSLLADGGYVLPAARLEDRFGGYGLIGAALIERGPQTWWVRLLALSCRVAGRGVSLGFLRWIMDRARADGATELRVDSRPTSANLELRLLFRQAGLRLLGDVSAASIGTTPVTLGRSLAGPLPDYPPWLDVVQR